MSIEEIEQAIDSFTENICHQDYSKNNKIYFGYIENDSYQFTPITAKQLAEYIYAYNELTKTLK